jgi:hypothetical protein
MPVVGFTIVAMPYTNVQTALTLMSLGLYNEPRGAFLPSIIY